MWQPMNPSLILAQAGGEGAPGGSAPVAPGGPVGTPAGGDAGSIAPASGDGAQAPASPPGGSGMFLMLMAVLGGMIVISLLGGRKEKKKKAALMASMGKGDRVQTIGGVLGTVVEVRDNDVLVKVDENANTKIRFAKSAVQTVLDSKANKSDEDTTDADETKDDA